MATPSLKWDASDVALKVTTASGGVVTLNFPDRVSDVAFDMPPTAITNPMTTAGDIIVATTDGVPARVAIGTNGQVLQSNGTTAVWATLPYITNPMTTDGDLIVGGASGAATRLAIGTAGKVLTSNGTTATWEAPVTGLSNPMTTLGDIITADTGGTAKRLGVGSEGQVLKVVSGEPSWSSPPSAKTYYDIDPLQCMTWTELTDSYTLGSRFFVTSTASCTGARVWGKAGKTYRVKLYDDAGNVLATKDGTASETGILEIAFDAGVSLTAYRVYEVSYWCTSGDSRFIGNNDIWNCDPLQCGNSLFITGYYHAVGDARPTTKDDIYRNACYPKF